MRVPTRRAGRICTTGLVVTVGLVAGLTTSTARSIESDPGRQRVAGIASVSTAATTAQHIGTTRWGVAGLSHGRFLHTRLHRSGPSRGVVIGAAPTAVTYKDPYGRSGRLGYDLGRWYSPWVKPGFGLTRLVASYDANTPFGTFIEVSVRGQTMGGRLSSWDSLGRWAGHDRQFHRMSLGAQNDDHSKVAVDTLVTNPGVAYRSWQLRVSLYRRTGSGRTPSVSMVAAVASRLPSANLPTSKPGSAGGVDLPVPRYSQMIHKGQYPQWNGGGEAWCSPTSTSMLLAFWHRGPTPRQYSWVKPSYRQPRVDYAARYTFAWGYDGTGDWPFNTAYAARFGLDSFVTRLRSLREAELFIKARIPLAASISFGPGELTGAPIRSSNGHLVVIRGFTRKGNVIVNDPAARNAKYERRVYRRSQFENAWIDSGGGVVYVVHPRAFPLPAASRHSNW
ncbi:MAG: peptidase C39 family protein [Nocardioidaceae bacterium]